MSERIHVHAAPEDSEPSGWILVFAGSDTPIGPFPNDVAAASYAGEWLTIPCCVVPLLNPAEVRGYLLDRECERQFPSDERG